MNIGILITARLKSTRLKRKVLRPLAGRPMLNYMIDRLRLSKYGQNIILCTSDLKDDDDLAQFASSKGIGCYRGHPDDVLARNVKAAQLHDVDLILSCTADNPLIDPVWLDRLAERIIKEDADFGTVRGIPIGTFGYCFKRSSGEQASALATTTDTEVWGGYFTQTGKFKCIQIDVDNPDEAADDLRLTVDEPMDFALIEALVEQFGQELPTVPHVDIIRYLRENSDVAAINGGIMQKPGAKIRT